MSDKNGLSWSIYSTWNASLETRAERPLKKRDHIWASEIGGSMIDRYLKMNAVPQTNPPNARSLRKFEAGNIFEWLLEFVLKRAGILLDSQEWVGYQYPGLLRTTGKLDFLAGGQPDWDRARTEVLSIGLPETINRATLAIIDSLYGIYGDSVLKTIILECKSVSSFMMDRYERLGKANDNHRGQLFHYLKAKGLDEGHIVYVCKDDCRMLELGVYNPSSAEQEYKSDIERITEFINTQTEPPKEQEVLFDPEEFRFSTNWKVEYSTYLSHLYGYKEPADYRAQWDKPVSDFNRVFKRCVAEKKMTDKNLEILSRATKIFPQWSVWVDSAKEAAKTNPELVAGADED